MSNSFFRVGVWKTKSLDVKYKCNYKMVISQNFYEN